MIVYEIAIHLLALMALPFVLYQWVVNGKYRKSLFSRFGFRFPKIAASNRPLIWIHAVSFGETRAILPLIERLKQNPSNPRILLTATTETGFEEGKKAAALVDYHAYLPLDFIEIMAPLMKRVKPSLIILSETDVWANFLRMAKKIRADVILVNGKISERSFRRLKCFPSLIRRLYGSIDHFYLQSKIYEERFLILEIAPEKITVTGNIKWDAPVQKVPLTFKEELGISEGDFVLTIGSTHAPEETILLKALLPLFSRYPKLKVILAPRHPERFEEVAKLIKSFSLPFSRLSKREKLLENRILLIDEMGSLKQCYGVSDLAFVGGSLTPKVGGHNIVEPSFYHVPTLFGPYLHNQPDMRDLVLRSGAGMEVRADELSSTFEMLMKRSDLLQQMGKRGEELVNSSRGALDLTMVAIDTLLKKEAI